MDCHTPSPAPQTNPTEPAAQHQTLPDSSTEKILCPHCRRTATNGIKCKGICVADSDY